MPGLIGLNNHGFAYALLSNSSGSGVWFRNFKDFILL